MAVRLRLRRMGRKKKPFYRIVAIDQRKRRDGKYLENLGYYNPVVEPAEVSLKSDRALYWLGVGAQPSDTVRSLLKRSGIMLRFDLMKRGKNEEEVEAEFSKWQSTQDERRKKVEAEKVQKQKAQAEAEAKAVAEAEKKAKAEAAAAAKAQEAEQEAVEQEAAPEESGDEAEAASEKEE